MPLGAVVDRTDLLPEAVVIRSGAGPPSAPIRRAVSAALRFRNMGLFSRMFAGRDRRADPPVRTAKRTAAPGKPKKAVAKKAAAKNTGAKNPVYRHAGCSIQHRSAEAASGCRNR